VAELDLSGVDVEYVLKKLILHANRLFLALVGLAGSGVLPGLGVGPKDLAMQTVLRFIDPEDRTVVWKKKHGAVTTEGVLRYLRAVLHHDLLDLLRLKAHETTVVLDPHPDGQEQEDGTQRRMSLDDFASALEGPDGRVIREERHAQLLVRMANEPELRDLLALQLDPDGYPARTNQELAQILGISVSEVENHKKRLNRRLLGISREASEDSTKGGGCG